MIVDFFPSFPVVRTDWRKQNKTEQQKQQTQSNQHLGAGSVVQWVRQLCVNLHPSEGDNSTASCTISKPDSLQDISSGCKKWFRYLACVVLLRDQGWVRGYLLLLPSEEETAHGRSLTLCFCFDYSGFQRNSYLERERVACACISPAGWGSTVQI